MDWRKLYQPMKDIEYKEYSRICIEKYGFSPIERKEMPNEKLSVREKIIRLAFEMPKEVLEQTIGEWEATLDVLNDPELLRAIEQGEREIKSGLYVNLNEARERLFGGADVQSNSI